MLEKELRDSTREQRTLKDGRETYVSGAGGLEKRERQMDSAQTRAAQWWYPGKLTVDS